MNSRSRYLLFSGLAVHYQIIMPRGAVAQRVLLVPSPGMSTYNWRLIVPELAESGCLCVVCDLPGFGKSMCGPDVPHQQDQRAQLLWGVLDEVDAEIGHGFMSWHLIGHGSAAGTVAAMTVVAPDSVTSMILLNPIMHSVIPRALCALLCTRFGTGFLKRWYRKHILSPERFNALLGKLYGRNLSLGYTEKIREPLAREGFDEMLGDILRDGYSAPTAQLNDLFTPAMVLWGGRDWLLGGEIPRKIRRHTLSEIECHTIRSAGHCIAETHSPAVRDYIRGWVKSH